MLILKALTIRFLTAKRRHEQTINTGKSTILYMDRKTRNPVVLAEKRRTYRLEKVESMPTRQAPVEYNVARMARGDQARSIKEMQKTETVDDVAARFLMLQKLSAGLEKGTIEVTPEMLLELKRNFACINPRTNEQKAILFEANSRVTQAYAKLTSARDTDSCPTCKSPRIGYVGKGETICKKCGTVIAEREAFAGPGIKI